MNEGVDRVRGDRRSGVFRSLLSGLKVADDFRPLISFQTAEGTCTVPWGSEGPRRLLQNGTTCRVGRDNSRLSLSEMLL